MNIYNITEAATFLGLRYKTLIHLQRYESADGAHYFDKGGPRHFQAGQTYEQGVNRTGNRCTAPIWYTEADLNAWADANVAACCRYFADGNIREAAAISEMLDAGHI